MSFSTNIPIFRSLRLEKLNLVLPSPKGGRSRCECVWWCNSLLYNLLLRCREILYFKNATLIIDKQSTVVKSQALILLM